MNGGRRFRLWILLVAVVGPAVATVEPSTAQTACPPPAAPLTFGETVACIIHNGGEIDEFTFSGDAGDRIRVRLVETSGPLNALAEVARPSGSQLCLTAGVEMTCTLDESGTYRLRIRDDNGIETGFYSFVVQRVSDPVGCTAIPFGTVTGSLDAAGEMDCFTFPAAFPDRVRVVLEPTSTPGFFSPIVDLVRPSGETSCGGMTRFSCPVIETGTQLLLVRDQPGTRTGTYRLTVYRIEPVTDFDGDEDTDIVVYRPSNGMWFFHGGGIVNWGAPGDIPVPGYYDSNEFADIGVYRPSTGFWFLRNIGTLQWGTTGDIPAPADYNGGNRTQVAVFRPSTGVWYRKFATPETVIWGTEGDVPVPADYDGDGDADPAVFRPSTSTWFVQGGATVAWGTSGDVPVPGDYNGDNVVEIAVFRPSAGIWFVQGGPTVAWGTSGDVPVPGDYNADNITDIAVFRPSTGTWFVRDGVTLGWGTSGDKPLPLPSPVSQAYFP